MPLRPAAITTISQNLYYYHYQNKRACQPDFISGESAHFFVTIYKSPQLSKLGPEEFSPGHKLLFSVPAVANLFDQLKNFLLGVLL